jgi:hypothetical protein
MNLVYWDRASGVCKWLTETDASSPDLLPLGDNINWVVLPVLLIVQRQL